MHINIKHYIPTDPSASGLDLGHRVPETKGCQGHTSLYAHSVIQPDARAILLLKLKGTSYN